MENKNTKTLLWIIISLIVVVFIVVVLWFFFFRNTNTTPSTGVGTDTGTGFSPFGTTSSGGGKAGKGTTATSTHPIQAGTPGTPLPTLRLLSDTPVGGYGASTTASTTVVRWVDRGRGNILEAREDSWNIQTLSNTLVPRIYESAWNKDLSAFVASLLPSGSNVPTIVYANLKRNPVGTSSTDFNPINLSPFDLQGLSLPTGIVSYAISPKKDKLFFFSVQNGRGIGYTSAATGGTLTQLFDSPLTQVQVSWPEDNTIAIVTNGNAKENGFLYFVNPKTGAWTKVIGPVFGLSATVSHDAKYVFVSGTGDNNNILSYIYSVAKNTYNDAIVQTLADKCSWGNFYKAVVYCGVPSRPTEAIYPDDWYQGTVSLSDKLWQINAETGELKQLSAITDQSDRTIDSFNVSTDTKDNFLLFMNKDDLSLWSLDLVRSNK